MSLEDIKINNKLVISQFVKNFCVFLELISPFSFFIDVIFFIVFFEKLIQIDGASSRVRGFKFFNEIVAGLDLNFFCEFCVRKLKL